MATIRRKKPEPFALLQRDPGPWSPILLYWLATLGIIIVFGCVVSVFYLQLLQVAVLKNRDKQLPIT